MKRITIIAVLLFSTVALFAQVTSAEWDYVDLFYAMPPTGTEYSVDCSVVLVWQHQEGSRPWCVQVNTAIELAGVFWAAPVLLLFDKKPEFIERIGQRFRFLVSFNSYWSAYNMVTFRFVEIVEAIE